MANKNPGKDFDAIAKALESGDTEALDRLMAVEEETQEDLPEEDTVVEDTDSNDEPEKEEEDDAPESEDTPEEVDNGDSNLPEEDNSETEAAVQTAASNDTDRVKELEKELQRYKSDAGRVPFIQSRMSQLERELRAYKARDAQPTTGAGGATVKTDGVTLDPETQKEIDELREIDPVMAKTMERIAKLAIATAAQRADHVVETFTQHEQEQEEYNFLMQQKQELIQEIPQADAIFQSPHWKQWKETLTPGQRAMAESSYASEVKQAIYAFAAAMQAAQGVQPTQPTQVQSAPANTEAADKLKEARNRKVQTAADVRAPAARRAVELDEEAIFREAYEKVGKENHLI